MQPAYLPWLGYFDLIDNVKDFIFLDNVKFNKSSFDHQNKIIGTNGVILLSVPTHAPKGRMDTMINEIKIDDSRRWRKKHLLSIEQSYQKTPYYSEIYPGVEGILNGDIKTLSELNIALIKFFSSLLIFNVNFHIASQMKCTSSEKVQRLIDFCKIQGSSSYYSPEGSLDYLDTSESKELFNSAGINVYFQKFKLIPYLQKSKEFSPYMSILDSLMNIGPDGTRDIIRKGSCIKNLT